MADVNPNPTPMMQQYYDIKRQVGQDSILFFRLGDFYEMFDEDARLASRELDLTLTTRDRSKENPDDRTPMCGVPYHSSEAYIARLVAKGYNVSICEQTEDPAVAKGLVRREIVRTITPGTVMESSMLDDGKNNYIAAAYSGRDGWAVSFCDISTGEFSVCGDGGEGAFERALTQLGRYRPAEIILGGGADGHQDLSEFLKRLSCKITKADAGLFEVPEAESALKRQLHADALEDAGVAGGTPRAIAAGALMGYLNQTQKTELGHINRLEIQVSGKFMELDLTARRNLELTETLRSKEKKGSLLWILDQTKTSMGGRLIRAWIENPLLNPAEINSRLDAVAELYSKTVQRGELSLILKGMSDMERLMGRIVYGTANCRDLVSLAETLSLIPGLLGILEGMDAPLLKRTFTESDPMADVCGLIRTAIVDDPPFSVREGGIIRAGYDAEVDRLRDIMNGGRGSVAAIESGERERTGVKTLKVGYNKVFGYYIEVSKSYLSMVPDTYVRKQTLANCERYITQELKDLEATILSAQEQITGLEYDIFEKVRGSIAEQVRRAQATAGAIARLDALISFAAVSAKNNYIRPEVDYSDVISIKDGRHPVVEQTLKNSLFVPNDTQMDRGPGCVAIITGPNMAGKSTYMRQVALITLMAQAGCFVPAKAARVGVTDRIFTRIGAADDLASGQSTFMVEMTEVSDILKSATGKSLLILDEIGRGTSTFDGMAIARAVLEYAADKKRLRAKTLFATHYHELTELESVVDGVSNYNIAAKKRGDEIIFLRKIVRGGADDSYGIEVAKLAGVPEPVISRARQVLKSLEQGAAPALPAGHRARRDDSALQVSMTDMRGAEVCRRINGTDLNTLTPIEAMNLLFELKQLAQ